MINSIENFKQEPKIMKLNKKKRLAAQGAAQPTSVVAEAPAKKIAAPTKSEVTDQKNLETAKTKIKAAKDLMYNYVPGDMSGDEKKKFRAAARRTKESYYNKISKAKPEEKDAIIAEASKWAKDTYTQAHRPSFSTPVAQ